MFPSVFHRVPPDPVARGHPVPAALRRSVNAAANPWVMVAYRSGSSDSAPRLRPWPRSCASGQSSRSTPSPGPYSAKNSSAACSGAPCDSIGAVLVRGSTTGVRGLMLLMVMALVPRREGVLTASSDQLGDL